MNVVLPFLYYSFVSGITPGPANICSLSTAIRKGRKVALRQWRGLFAGYFVVSVSSALITWFIGTAFSQYVRYFSFIGVIYILCLAIHIMMDKGEDREEDMDDREKTNRKHALREGTFWFGFWLQASNVKVIIFCLTVFTGYVLPYRSDLITLLLVGILLPFIGPVCNLAWLLAGERLQTVLEKHRTIINTVMALSLVVCAFSMIRI